MPPTHHQKFSNKIETLFLFTETKTESMKLSNLLKSAQAIIKGIKSPAHKSQSDF